MWGGREIPFKKKLVIISLRTMDLISVHITTAGLDLIFSQNFQLLPVATSTDQCTVLPRTAPRAGLAS